MERLQNSYFLYPSKIIISRAPADIVTVLGSCVSVCLWDTIKKYGGMNHFMLPLWNGKELASLKYGNIAIERLVSEMIKLGSDKKNMVAKVIGGSEAQEGESVFRIGKSNVEIAFRTLQHEKIRIINESTGTKSARRIIFRTSTGEVFMNFISEQDRG
jgi:chemotaxis protein CheD